MPRFFFDVSDGRCSPDPEGIVLADGEAVRREANRRAAMLQRVTHATKGTRRVWKLAVRDEAGSIVFCIEAPLGMHFRPALAS